MSGLPSLILLSEPGEEGDESGGGDEAFRGDDKGEGCGGSGFKASFSILTVSIKSSGSAMGR